MPLPREEFLRLAREQAAEAMAEARAEREEMAAIQRAFDTMNKVDPTFIVRRLSQLQGWEQAEPDGQAPANPSPTPEPKRRKRVYRVVRKLVRVRGMR